MRINVGSTDRVLRILLGAVLIALVFVGPQIDPSFSYWQLGWIGVVPLITGFVSFCPLYAMIGIRTCRPR